MRPEPILSNEPGSLAWHAWNERHPALIRRMIAAHPYPEPIAAALHGLLAETLHGTIPAAPGWTEHAGEGWLDAPFLWAESYFYHRLLDATGFRTPGPWHGVDPYAVLKAAELAEAPVDGLAQLSLVEVMHAALWGNQADISFRIGVAEVTGSGVLDRAEALVVDDTDAAVAALAGRVVLVADNAGRELLADLVLADHLLVSGRVGQVAVHVKPVPYYVSDATTTDLVAALARLASGPPAAAGIAERLREAAATDRFVVATHEFYCAPYEYERMPADLTAVLAAADVVVVKGDLNYRRLVGDRRWPHTVPFGQTVAHFPAPVVALRTLKSDVTVGLTADEVSRLDAEAEDWRTSGRYGLIQARL